MSEPINHKIRIVCSDQGQHRARLLAVVIVNSNGEVWLESIPHQWKQPRVERRWQSPPVNIERTAEDHFRFAKGPEHEAADRSEGVWRFSCPNCWRTPEISVERWDDLWRTTAAAGVARVDLSHLRL